VLGYANPEDIGDDEPASSALPLALGGVPRDMGGGSKCALMSDGSLRCWGANSKGQLGYGHTNKVGYDGDILSAGTVQVGGAISKLSKGLTFDHTCVLLDDGVIRCWGLNANGELGLGHQENIGDNEIPVDVPPVRLFE
jgi:alpha-tubulin suppressor-like RCC1 family protein